MHTARRILLPLFAAGLILALAAPFAMARVVEVAWSPDVQADLPHTRDQAREAAFRRAVFGEALDILPGALSLPRQELLRLYLLPHAADYVLSYSEEAVQPQPAPAPEAEPAAQNATEARPGQFQTLMPEPEPQAPQERVLRLDVTVNRAALKKMLRGMGVYFTTSDTRSFDLALSGDASGAWEELGRLQALSGLTVSRGAEPQLELSTEWVTPEPDKKAKNKEEPAPVLTWTGRLSMEGDAWTATDVDLSKVWFTLWGRFFSRPGAEAGVVEQVPLAVTGWYAADGVRAFDKELASWDGLVEGETLIRVVMLPDGIGGVWTVRTLDRDALAERLRAVLPGRGLSWDFSEEPGTP